MFKIGVVSAWINSNLKSDPLAHCITACNAKLILTTAGLEKSEHSSDYYLLPFLFPHMIPSRSVLTRSLIFPLSYLILVSYNLDDDDVLISLNLILH